VASPHEGIAREEGGAYKAGCAFDPIVLSTLAANEDQGFLGAEGDLRGVSVHWTKTPPFMNGGPCHKLATKGATG